MKTKLQTALIVLTTILNISHSHADVNSNSEICCSEAGNACCPVELNENKRSKAEEFLPVTLPFEYKNRLITLQVGLISAEDTHEFILDTGAPTFITDSVVRTHDLMPFDSETVYDINHYEQKVDLYSIRKLHLGNSEIKNVKARSSSMVEQMPLLKDRPYSGLLGANAMKNSIWIINYNCREITITKDIDTVPLPGEVFSGKMKTDELNRPIITVNLAEEQSLDFIIDMGYNGSMLLPKKFMTKPLFNDSLSFSSNDRISSGFDSKISSINYKFIKEIAMGEMKLENIKSSTAGNNTEALIGNEFLENYIVVLDFVNDLVTFLPADETCGNHCC
jgi:hypothetical protein